MAVSQQGIDTSTRIIDVAERLMQTRGFNGFSFADIARELGLTKAALQYHFDGKAELGEAVIARYVQRFFTALDDLERADADAATKLQQYMDLYRGVLEGKRMCLCGMLAAEHEILPPPMRTAIIDFFARNERWVVAMLTEGRDAGTLRFTGSAQDTAKTLVSALEGAMMIARLQRDLGLFEATVSQILTNILVSPQPV